MPQSLHDAPLSLHTVQTWNRQGTLLGGAICLLALGLSETGRLALGPLDWLILFAMFVIVPLALGLTAPQSDNDVESLLYRALIVAQTFAAVIAALSFALPKGPSAAALAGVWLLFTGFVALFGLVHWISDGVTHVPAICTGAALLYLPVGGIWLVFARLGTNPLGFQEPVVSLTAIHFHYITLAALILAGMTGRVMAQIRPTGWALYRLAAIGLLIGPPLVALGITFSLALEVIAALILVASVMVVAVLTLRFIAPGVQAPLARGLLALSSAAVLLTMLLAGAYTLGRFTGVWQIDIPHMIEIHGWLNALGFSLCGLLGWRIRQQVSA